MLDESESREAEWTLGLIRNLLMLFKDSVEGLESRTIPSKVFRTSNLMKPKIFLSGKFLYLLMLQERKVNDCLDMLHTYVSNISREKLAGSLRKGLRFDKLGFTKTNMLSTVASCWSPLNEVGPLLTSGKLALSNLWKLQKILAERLKSAKEDLRPRKISSH